MATLSRKRSQASKIAWRVGVILALALVVLTIRLVEQIGPDKFGDERFVVVRVIDGDTIELTGGDKVRLLAIDAPEKGEPLHDQATDELSRMTLGKSVRLEYSGRRRDRYGRLLGFVYADDTLLVNGELLKRGLASVYLFNDTDNSSTTIKELLTDQREGIKNLRGIWALEHEPEYYYISLPGSFRFHRPGCPSLSRSNPSEHIRYEKREQAMAQGLSPCRNCKP